MGVWGQVGVSVVVVLLGAAACGGKSGQLGATVAGSGGVMVMMEPEPNPAGRGGGGAGGTGAGGTGVGGTGAGGMGNVLACDVSESRDDYENGFELCDGSATRIHRSEAGTCRSLLPRENIMPVTEFDACNADTDCTERPHGHCDPGAGFEVASLTCQYGCVVDSDCEAGSICLCGTWIGYCTQAECVTDADCPDGLLCAAWWRRCHSEVGFACQNPADECFDDSACGDGRCERQSGDIRRCTSSTQDCGF